ncbi:MAG: hypothetical protein MZU95_02065 [Desulfomicrobium escambiense]|nr:hypothetical protein [Desulfomicrobium escambiense]
MFDFRQKDVFKFTAADVQDDQGPGQGHRLAGGPRGDRLDAEGARRRPGRQEPRSTPFSIPCRGSGPRSSSPRTRRPRRLDKLRARPSPITRSRCPSPPPDQEIVFTLHKRGRGLQCRRPRSRPRSSPSRAPCWPTSTARSRRSGRRRSPNSTPGTPSPS